MTEHHPDKRPSLDQARRTMDIHFAGLLGWRLRWPIMPADVSFQQRCVFVISGMTRELVFLLRRIMRLLLLRNH